MPRPDTNATIIDTDSQSGEGNDVSENSTHQEDNQNVAQPGGAADSLGGEEARDASENVGPKEGEVPAEEGDTESEPVEPPFDVEAITGPLKEQLRAEIMQEVKQVQETQAAQQKPLQLSEEQWAAKEQEWGVPRQAIQRTVEQGALIYTRLKGEVEQMLNERFAGIEKDNQLKILGQSKDFGDINAHRKGIDEFLSKYDAKHHSNPELLKMAYYYSKGKSSSSSLQKARTEAERNKKIVGPARPSAPNSGQRPATRPLSEAQRDVAKQFGMSEEDYRKYKTQKINA